MKLHYMRTMNPQKACVTAKYLGSPVEYVLIDAKGGGLGRPEYLALNPNGLAPVLEDGDYKLWESTAIMAYLAHRAGSDLWPAKDAARQVEVLRWISWNNDSFAPHAGSFYFEHYVKPWLGLGEPDERALEAAVAPLHKAARILDAHLAGRRYLVGDTLSIADFCTAILLPHQDAIRLPLADFANIQRWHERLMELPAWRDPWPS